MKVDQQSFEHEQEWESERPKFNIEFKEILHGRSIGIAVSHANLFQYTETYLYINLYKWTLSIGKFVKEVEWKE